MTSAPTLAARLRTETRSHHAQAERAGIMPALLRGRLDRATYGRLLVNLQALYQALEAGLVRRACHPQVAPVYLPALFRLPALEADLQALGIRQADRALCSATQAYVARLHHIADHAPECLVAHAYTRYLGDLSGGQMLGQTVARSLGLTGDAGIGFYQFGSPAEVAQHVQAFRAGLNALPLDSAACDRVVAETTSAFQRHVALFEELAAG